MFSGRFHARSPINTARYNSYTSMRRWNFLTLIAINVESTPLYDRHFVLIATGPLKYVLKLLAGPAEISFTYLPYWITDTKTLHSLRTINRETDKFLLESPISYYNNEWNFMIVPIINPRFRVWKLDFISEQIILRVNTVCH